MWSEIKGSQEGKSADHIMSKQAEKQERRARPKG